MHPAQPAAGAAELLRFPEADADLVTAAPVIFLPLGLALFLVGLVTFVYDPFLWNLSETAVMAFLAAMVVWSVGRLADMIAQLQLKPSGAA